jgi:biotin carboxylase
VRMAIVDGYGIGRFLVQRLREAGADCIHLQSDSHPAGAFRKSFQPELFSLDLGFSRDVQGLTARLAGLAVARVVAGAESGVYLADTLSGRLGLPGNTPELARASTDKALMMDLAAQAGVAVPAGRAFGSVADAVAWFAAAGLGEVVAKPVSSAGTDHVYFCARPDELGRAGDQILGSVSVYGHPTTRMLVQERVRGTEYCVNTVSHDGSHKIAEMWRYVKAEGPVGGPVYDYDEPVTADEPPWQVVREFTGEVLDALGIRSGAAHTEVMMTGSGPVLIESSARLGGSARPGVVEAYCGVSQAGLLAATLLDPARLASFDDSAVRCRSALRLVEFRNRTAGRAVQGWAAAIESLPSVVAMDVAPSPGDWLEPTRDLMTSPGSVYLASADAAQVGRDYRLLRRWEEAGLYTGASPGQLRWP